MGPTLDAPTIELLAERLDLSRDSFAGALEPRQRCAREGDCFITAALPVTDPVAPAALPVGVG